MIDTGKTTYDCGVAGSSGNSGKVGASSTTTTAKPTVNGVTEKGSSSALGVKISASSATFAGQPSTSLTVTARLKGASTA